VSTASFSAVATKESHPPRVIETWPVAMGRMGGLFAWGGRVMSVLVAFLHRYVSPFVAGVCAAAATVVSNVPMMVVLLLAAGVLVFMSLPAGGRMIRRMAAERGG
jgi:ABC-type amino acid transport system permease subunit